MITLSIIVFAYFGSFVMIRRANSKVWEKDGQTYVIFPPERVYLYYLFRPVSYLDGAVTGIRFHIGEH